MDGLVTENDIHSVVEVPEIVLGGRQLTAVVLWVVPAGLEEEKKEEKKKRINLGTECAVLAGGRGKKKKKNNRREETDVAKGRWRNR